VIDGTTVIATIPVRVPQTGVALAPRGVAYDPSNGYLYVTTCNLNFVLVINGTTVIATIPVGYVGTAPWGVAYDPSNGYIYITNFFSDTVCVIDGANNTVIATIPVGQWPEGVAYDPSNGYIYVANSGSDTVSVINGATNTVIANITVGAEPTEVAYDPSNGYIYVTDYDSNTVSVINGKTVIANITVGADPWGIAYDPSNGYLYVTNYDSGTVSIISTPAQAIKTYTVTFTESGLSAGTQWSVTFDGLTKSSTSNNITFTGVLAGNYTWNASSIITVGSGTRYVVQTSSGTISVPNVSSVSLYYVKQYRVTIQPTAGGSTSPSGTFWYNAGSTINITATPAPGYEFVGWETNSSITFTNSSSATTNAIINSPGTIVAVFKAVPSSTQSSTASVNTTSVSTSSTSISSVTTSTTSTSTIVSTNSTSISSVITPIILTSTNPTHSLVPTLVVVVVVIAVVSLAALLMIKFRKP
jgi:YVTN family beta-propeller protein